jgi:integrase
MRLTESGSLKREDVDLVGRTITLRGGVVKNHNGMCLPMSELLFEILSARLVTPADQTKAERRRRRPRDLTYVFPSFGKKKPYIYDARATLEEVSKIVGRHVSMHSLRRTAEDIAKAVKVDPDERRILLNHKPKDVHGESYSNDADPEVLRPSVDAMAAFVVNAARVAASEVDGGAIAIDLLREARSRAPSATPEEISGIAAS